jgi:hypothetical protein
MLTGEIQLTIAIPFEGNYALFDCTPSKHASDYPEGKIVDQEIHFEYRIRELDAETIQNENQQRIKLINKYLEWMKSDIEQHNRWIKEHVKEQVHKRRQQALKTQGFLESINLPIKRRNDLPDTYIIPVARKKVVISRPAPSLTPFHPELTIAEEEYEYILETISNMSLAMERNPRTFSRLAEEEIRDFFLIILNSHYEGQATGETFNVTGKTDILIRAENRNAFVAECKIWNGPKTLLRALDQILSYSNWRDTKTAVLLFNTNRAFSHVVSKIDETVKSHDYYKKHHSLKSRTLNCETIFSYIFHQSQDKNREMIISIMSFNIPN